MKTILFAFLFIYSTVSQAVVSGTYNCQLRISQTVTANGRTTKFPSVTSGQVTFFPDGTSESRNPSSPFITRGTWSQVGRKLFMQVNMDDAARDAIYGCESSGADCSLIGLINNGSSKVSANNRVITGTGTVRLTMIVNGILANSTASTRTTCSQ